MLKHLGIPAVIDAFINSEKRFPLPSSAPPPLSQVLRTSQAKQYTGKYDYEEHFGKSCQLIYYKHLHFDNTRHRYKIEDSVYELT